MRQNAPQLILRCISWKERNDLGDKRDSIKIYHLKCSMISILQDHSLFWSMKSLYQERVKWQDLSGKFTIPIWFVCNKVVFPKKNDLNEQRKRAFQQILWLLHSKIYENKTRILTILSIKSSFYSGLLRFLLNDDMV